MVVVVEAADCTPERFREEFLRTNQPVLLRGAASDWRACKEWVKPDGQPDLSFLRRRFGSSNVCITWCHPPVVADTDRESAAGVTSIHELAYNEQMTLNEYIDKHGGSFRGESVEPSDDPLHPSFHPRRGTANQEPCAYVKDWHLVQEFPEYQAYTVPEVLSDDWLNMEHEHGDYRFVYCGPAGSFTPLHKDVLRSYSWSANICGRKLWLMFPPEASPFLRDRHHDCIEDVLSFTPHLHQQRFPHLRTKALPLMQRVLQQPGDVLFVPSDWHHQVHNLDDCLSLNHNWCNAFNVHHMRQELDQELDRVHQELQHLRHDMSAHEYQEQCQRMLRALSGMDHAMFAEFLGRSLKMRTPRNEEDGRNARAVVLEQLQELASLECGCAATAREWLVKLN